MKLRTIGGRQVPEIGLGCMNLSHAYGAPLDVEEGIRLLHTAFDLGVRHFDTAVLYGFGRNEELVGRALKDYRQDIHLASKCGLGNADGGRVIDGRPENLMVTVDGALTRLQTDHIDLYYLHRLDKSVPIEESMGALARMVEQGKVGAVGLSEVSADTLRRAHAVHPVAAVQTEYSLWTRNPELGVLDACEELGAAFVAFSPLARGFLAGGIGSPEELAEGDIRRNMPRFQEPHFSNNTVWLEQYSAIAKELGCTAGQLSLRWLLQKRPFIIPIPGTRSEDHLRENLAASDVTIPNSVLEELEALINPTTVSGSRYADKVQAEIDTEEYPK